MKQCRDCLEEKPLGSFHMHPQMRDGHLNKCKDCVRKRVKKYTKEKEKDPQWLAKERKRQREKTSAKRYLRISKTPTKEDRYKATSKYRKSHPLKHAAHMAVQVAIKSQKLFKQPCQVCGNPNSEAHHDNYEEPLNVLWLCSKHHAARHVQLREIQLLS